MKFKSYIFFLFCLIIFSSSSTEVKGAVPSLSNLNFTPKQVIMDSTKPVLYAIDAEGKKVYSINFETKAIKSIQLDLIPERIYLANNELYVALLKSGHQPCDTEPEEGSIAIINSDKFTLADQFNIDIDPFDIVVDNNGHIFVTGGSNGWTNIRSYSRQTKQRIDVGGAQIGAQSYAEINVAMNKIYTIDRINSPCDINMFTIADGKFPGPNYDSPYHGEYAMSSKMKTSPDGKYLFNGAGTIFQCSTTESQDMTYVTALDSGFSDITFDLKNNKFYTINKGHIVKIYEYTTLKLLDSYDAPDEVISLFNSNNEMISICKTIDNKYSVEVFDKNNVKGYPQKGTLTIDNPINTGNYSLTINVPEKSNVTSYKLYCEKEVLNGGKITSTGLEKTIKVNGKLPGLYNYNLETINEEGKVSTLQLTVTVVIIDPKLYYPTLFSFAPKQSIMNPAKTILYFIGEGSNNLYSMNLETKQLSFISLGLQPERMYFTDNELYVALTKNKDPEQGIIDIINPDKFTITDQFNIDLVPFDMVVDKAGNVFVTGGVNQWTSIQSYSRQTKQRIDSAEIFERSYAEINLTMDKIYTINTDGIKMFTISNGKFSGPNYDSPSYNL